MSNITIQQCYATWYSLRVCENPYMKLLCSTNSYYLPAVLCQVFEILAHPEDITVDEGHLVHMPCQSTEVNEVPWWTINGNSHSTTDLPFGFHATESGLVFPAYSNSTFQCYFTRYHPNSGKSFRHYSRIGTVNVRQITGMDIL